MALPAVGGMAIELMTLFVVPTLYCLFEEVKFKLQPKRHQAPPSTSAAFSTSVGDDDGEGGDGEGGDEGNGGVDAPTTAMDDDNSNTPHAAAPAGVAVATSEDGNEVAVDVDAERPLEAAVDESADTERALSADVASDEELDPSE